VSIMTALGGLPPEHRQRMQRRVDDILGVLLEHEVTIKATSYDKDKQQGHYGSQVPPGVDVDTAVDGKAPPYWVSPYHHFRRRLELAEDEYTFRAILRSAAKRADELETPGRMVAAVGGTNWEEIEIEILEEGYGASPARIAEKYGIGIDLVEQIREESDHDPKTGEYAGEDEFIKSKVLEMHLVDGLPVDRIYPIVRKSRATVYRYIKEELKRRAAA